MPDRQPTPFGLALRHWRTIRRVSQLELATRAGTPPRHVSFLETGRARPSHEMVTRLAQALDVPLGERNQLFVSAGFAPAHSQRPLSDASLAAVREVIGRLLRAHEPYPALVLNAWYDVVDLNGGGRALFSKLLPASAPDADAVPAHVNLVELLLHPLRPMIVNWEEVILDTQARLRRAATERPSDARLLALLTTVNDTVRAASLRATTTGSPVLLTTFRTPAGPLATLSTLVHFSGARDVTVDDLHVELIYPADAAGEAALGALLSGAGAV